ncbi:MULTISPECIES: efflux transporter outer membrane subunit [unclassified Erwinia]|uniref:efflux transporter outer membrane subunit n=1 Tax=unclassified Erwinia TaxID=2622719 RepID=UPI0008361155|nr:efflux transporter outer membrane subunit [Erwinia sp. ErVv1]
MSQPAHLFRTLLLATATLLSGCIPAYQAPPSDAKVNLPAAWRDNPAFYMTAPGSPAWWTAFNDPQLTALVTEALQNNADLAVAATRVREARASLSQARSGFFPSVDLAASGQSARSLTVLGPGESRSWQPQAELSWEVDLWGKTRAENRAAQAQLEASEAAQKGAMLSVASATAESYIGLLGMDQQLKLTEDTVVSRRKALDLIRSQVDGGYASALELTQAESEYQSVLQSVPRLQQALRQQENALSVLTGRVPGSIRKGSLQHLAVPALPGIVPSELLRRRPDIVEAEKNLMASDETLRARRADFLPQLNLSASIGEVYTSGLNYDPVRIWSYGGSVLAPLFTAGRLQARYDVAMAQRDRAAWSYRATLLQALDEVEDGYAAQHFLQAQRAHSDMRVATLTRSLSVAQDRYQNGYASYLTVLDAQRSLYSSQLDNISLLQDYLVSYVTLYRALGGNISQAKGNSQQ